MTEKKTVRFFKADSVLETTEEVTRSGKVEILYANGDIFKGEAIKEGDDVKLMGAMSYSNGNTYEGELINDECHGKGIYKYIAQKGGHYEGEFSHGKRQGHGTYTFEKGDVYVGEWDDSERIKGKMTYANGDVYEGTFEGDRLGTKKYGTYWYNGSIKGRYEGNWKDGKRDGYGIFYFGTGDVFTGRWKDEERAEGKMEYANGDVYMGTCTGDKYGTPLKGIYFYNHQKKGRYEGEFNSKGERHGRGIYFFADGEMFNGEWKDGNRLNGKMHYKSGDTFEGEFEGDASGTRKKGTYYYNKDNCGHYTGEYCQGVRSGEGSYYFINGDVYHGKWKDGERHEGKMLYNNGDTFEGTFMGDKNGMRKQGTYVYTYEKRGHYRGEFINNARNGYGEYYWPEGSSFKGQWVDGERSDGTMTYANGDIFTGTFEKNKFGSKKFGVFREKATGNVYSGGYKLDKKDGPGTMNYANGDIYQGFFVRDKRHGLGKLTKGDKSVVHGEWHNDEKVIPKEDFPVANVIKEEKSDFDDIPYANPL